MQFNGPTYRRPRTVPERQFPPGQVVENSLRIWAISRWREPRELASFFLHAGYRQLPPGTPPMFHLHEQVDGNSNDFVIGLYVTFTNRYDAYHLLASSAVPDASLTVAPMELPDPGPPDPDGPDPNFSASNDKSSSLDAPSS
ncbi:Auxin-induced protein 5NG4 [Hordeum vulgare]|nr:Auxin-induced protein 5NG4 [Hordeum vulgare]